MIINSAMRRVLALGLALCVLSAPTWADSDARPMRAQTAHEMARAGDITLIDIRTPEEWKETGVPASGHAITMHQEPRVFLEKLIELTKGDKSKPIALICASGARSTHMHEQLTKLGFTNVINVSEGMMGGSNGRGWIKSGLPVSKWQTPIPK